VTTKDGSKDVFLLLQTPFFGLVGGDMAHRQINFIKRAGNFKNLYKGDDKIRVIQAWNPEAYRPPKWLRFGPTGPGKRPEGF
jgi:hypothetical protein